MERRAFGMQGRHATRAELAELAEVIAMTDNMLAQRRTEVQKTTVVPAVKPRRSPMGMAQRGFFGMDARNMSPDEVAQMAVIKARVR